ncbi:YhcN/YlaJ family sporulation lipoprotein [Paenibacillus filicis]|uniref:YhcN/YlaJ family sporulation lipoprotein n=1 Tax=Paenibacillus filicis TaxID=669464 RepID=A0ABU9DEM7_9BACL
MAKNIIGVAVLASMLALTASGCTAARYNQQDTHNYRSLQHGADPIASPQQPGIKGGMYANRTHASNLHNNTKLEAAQDIASRLTSVEPVKSANVLLTDHNAYVAVSTRNGEDVEGNNEVKARIAQTVKSMHPGIEHVYVSASPDFVSRVNGYMQDLQAGKPVSGLLQEFNTMVQRLFPTDAAPAQAPAGTAAP